MIFYLFVFLNFIAFTLFGVDKWFSIKHKRRISENVLLTSAFFGGTLGALLGMMVFRHKVSKRSFILKISLIIVIQIVTLVLWEEKIRKFAVCFL